MSERETNPVRKLTTVVKFGGYIFLDFGPKIKEDGNEEEEGAGARRL